MSKYNAATDFNIDYKKLTETDRNNFSRVSNKLLGVQYIAQQKEDDRKDYYFILKHLNMFKSYFSLLAYELNYYESDKVVMLANTDGANRLRLKKTETIILLIVRLLYQKKLGNELDEYLYITLSDIHSEIDSIGVFSKRITRTDMSQSLRLFKRYNLIDFYAPKFEDDDMKIMLYPTLLHAARYENIHSISEKIMQISKDEENEDEDTEEN